MTHELNARSRLARLLAPRSIAVIGGREAEEVARQCDRIGFSGDIWPVNPRRAEIAGRACFASIAELPRAPDAAFVAAPREASIAAVGELAARGANGAVVYASGFSEAGAEGAALERKLVAASGGMALIGPNCYGALNYLDGVALWPDQHGGARVERGVALVLQSGNIAVNLTMQARGLPLAYVVAVGNKAKGDFADYVEAFLDDERVTAIGLHIEGLNDAEALDRAARRARELRKPIVAIKTGRSEAGAALTLSHTASLAGPDALYDAFFARLGVARAPDLSIFLETLKLFHVSGPLKGRRLSSMSCSGGEASLMADLAPAHGLTTPDLPESAREALAAALGPKVAIGNPLDYHTYVWGEFEPTRAAFSAMLAAGYDMNALVLDFPRADRCDGSSWETTLAAFEAARAATGAPAAVVASLPETMPEAIAERLVAAGVVPFNGMSEALTAMRLAAEVGEAWARPASARLQPVGQAPTARPARMLDEAEAKARAGALWSRRSRVSRRPDRRGGASGGRPRLSRRRQSAVGGACSQNRCRRRAARPQRCGGGQAGGRRDGAFERARPDRTDEGRRARRTDRRRHAGRPVRPRAHRRRRRRARRSHRRSCDAAPAGEPRRDRSRLAFAEDREVARRLPRRGARRLAGAGQVGRIDCALRRGASRHVDRA